MTTTQTDRTRIAAMVEPELFDALARLASQQERSLAAEIRVALRYYVRLAGVRAREEVSGNAAE